MHTVRKGPGEFSPGPFVYFFLSWPLSVGTAVFSSDICLVNRSSGKGGDASGFAAMDISKSGLSSAAIRLEWNTPHLRHRWINAHSPVLRTHTPTWSIMPVSYTHLDVYKRQIPDLQWYFPLTGLLCRKRNVPLFTCCMGTGKTRMSGPV